MGNPEDTDPVTKVCHCVVDTHSRVNGVTNLFIGSCGVIPTGTACNPTLTAVALAVRASNHLIKRMKNHEFDS